MKIKAFSLVLFYLLLQFTVPQLQEVQAAEMVITGECFFAAPGGKNQGLESSLLSPADAVSLSIHGAGQRWKLVARVMDQEMIPRGIQLWVRRTDDGMGPGDITGGLFLAQLGAHDKTIFRGVGDISNIPLQFRLTGITPKTPEFSFNPEILFKVVDMP